MTIRDPFHHLRKRPWLSSFHPRPVRIRSLCVLQTAPGTCPVARSLLDGSQEHCLVRNITQCLWVHAHTFVHTSVGVCTLAFTCVCLCGFIHPRSSACPCKDIHEAMHVKVHVCGCVCRLLRHKAHTGACTCGCQQTLGRAWRTHTHLGMAVAPER